MESEYHDNREWVSAKASRNPNPNPSRNPNPNPNQARPELLVLPDDANLEELAQARNLTPSPKPKSLP